MQNCFALSIGQAIFCTLLTIYRFPCAVWPRFSWWVETVMLETIYHRGGTRLRSNPEMTTRRHGNRMTSVLTLDFRGWGTPTSTFGRKSHFKCKFPIKNIELKIPVIEFQFCLVYCLLLKVIFCSRSKENVTLQFSFENFPRRRISPKCMIPWI